MNDYLALKMNQLRLEQSARAAKMQQLASELKRQDAPSHPDITIVCEDCPPPRKPIVSLFRMRPRPFSA